MKKTTLRSEVVEALSLPELCRFCHAEEAWVVQLVEYGVLEPVGSSIDTWHFRGTSIVRAKKAHRLHQDLGVNAAGVAMLLDLLEERDVMMRRLAQYESMV